VSGARAVTLYGKPGCHLCDEARAALAEFEVHEVDISADPRLHARYGERIPVVEVDGEEVCHFVVDLEAVRARLGRVAP
jgi:glutaredoxin